MTTAIAAWLAGPQSEPASEAVELGPAEIVGAALAAAFLVALAVVVRRAHPVVVNSVWPQPEPNRPAFSLMDVALVVLGFLWVQVLVGLIVGAVAPEATGLASSLGLTIAGQGGTCLIIYGLVRRRELAHAGLGLRPGRTGDALKLGVAHYVGYAPFLVLAMVVSPLILDLVFGHEAELQEVAVMIREAAPSQRLLVAAVSVVVIPFLEEFIFRGFLQNALEEPLGKVAAVVVTSAVFALLHGIDAAIPIFVLSLVLGAVMLRTRRLVACWLVHGLHNGLVTALLFFGPSDVPTGS